MRARLLSVVLSLVVVVGCSSVSERPGTDAALALAITQVMIDRGWYDHDFVRTWTNGPLLVRSDNGHFLKGSDLAPDGSPQHYVAWDESAGEPVLYDPAIGRYLGADGDLACFGTVQVATSQGKHACRPAFDFVAEACRRIPLAEVAKICGVAGDQIVAAARMLWEARPVAYYAWSGVEQQTGATDIARAIAQLYALTGCLDEHGGNVLFTPVPTANVGGVDIPAVDPQAPTLGLAERPLGPARFGHVTTDELYRGILEGKPYPVHGLVTFGSNLLVSHADGRRGRAALGALDFYVHADLFMNPTAEMADIVLPVASCFESEALRPGFEVSAEAQAHVQLRRPVVAPRGEARSDTEIIFDLARHLGLGQYFWDGDIAAAYRQQLGPAGITLETLADNPGGVRLPLQTRYRKFAEALDGAPQGFNTPSRKIELYSEVFLAHGYAPVPVYTEPLVSPRAQPNLAVHFPLIFTCAKNTLFCESQNRNLPSLRRRALDPEVELHPEAAAARGIVEGDWVAIATPMGSVRARARFNATLAPDVVCGQHGWWQACPELGAPGYDPFSAEGSNLNTIIGTEALDPVSGSVPHRAYLCEISLAVPGGI